MIFPEINFTAAPFSAPAGRAADMNVTCRQIPAGQDEIFERWQRFGINVDPIFKLSHMGFGNLG